MAGHGGSGGGGFGRACFPARGRELVQDREVTFLGRTPCRKGRSHLGWRGDMEAACEPAVRLYLTFYLSDLPCLWD